MPHFCSELSNGSSAHSASKPKSLPGPATIFMVYIHHSPFATFAPNSGLLAAHWTPDMLWPQGLCTYGFFWLESSPLPVCQVSLNITLLERFSLTTSRPPELPYPVLYFPITCITTLSIHLFDCLLSRPTATTGDHKLHEGRHFCCVYCYVFSTKQHPDM